MTYSPSADQRGEASPLTEAARRLAWPLFVFSGTLCAYYFATDTNMCQVCPPKPLSSALPWAVAAGLCVLALQTWRSGPRASDTA